MRVVFGILATLVVIVIGLVVAPIFIDWSQYKAPALAQVKKITGYDVTFSDDFSVGILPTPHATLKDVSIVNASVSPDPIARFDELSVSVALMPLLQKQLHITQVKMIRPNIDARIDAQGRGSWLSAEIEAMYTGEEGAGEAPGSVSEKAQNGANSALDTPSSQAAIRIDALTIEGGRVRFADASKDSAIAVDDINVNLSIDSLHGPFDAQGSLAYNGEAITFTAQTGAMTSGQSALPLTATLAYGDYSVKYEGDVPLGAPFDFNGDLHGMIAADNLLINKDIGFTANIKGNPQQSITISDGEIMVKGGSDPLAHLATSIDLRDPDRIRYESRATIAKMQSVFALIKDLEHQGFMAALNIATLDAHGEITPTQIILTQGVLKLDDININASASIDLPKGEGAKPQVEASAQTTLDNPYAIAQRFGVDTSTFPAAVQSVKAKVTVKGASDALALDANIEALGGEFTVQADLDTLAAKGQGQGAHVRATHPNLKSLLDALGVDAPVYTVISKPIDVKGVVSMQGSVMRMNDINARLLDTTLNGSMLVDVGASKPSVQADLQLGDLMLKTANRSSALSAGAGSANATSTTKQGATRNPASQKWSSEPLDVAWLDAANITLNAQANRLVYEQWDLKNPSLAMSIQDGALTVQTLKAGAFNGEINAQAQMASQPAQGLIVKAQADITDVNIGDLAKALSGTDLLQGDGAVSLNTTIETQGQSQKAIISALNGTANLDGKNVVLNGFDLAGLASALLESNKPLNRVQKLVDASSGGGQTAFESVKGSYLIENGMVRIGSIALDGPAASISSIGGVNLPLWTIDTTHTITLNQVTSIDPFDVVIEGPLDKPVNTFGSGLFDTYLQEKLGAKIEKVIGDDASNVLKQFGILPTSKTSNSTANDNSGSSTNDKEQEAEESPEEAIKNVIRGLF